MENIKNQMYIETFKFSVYKYVFKFRSQNAFMSHRKRDCIRTERQHQPNLIRIMTRSARLLCVAYTWLQIPTRSLR